MLDRRGALYLSKVERPPDALEDLSPLPCEPELLDRFAGDQTVAEVLESGAIGERELYALLVAGLVETHDQSPLELHQVVLTAVAEEEQATELLELEGSCEPLEAGLLRELTPPRRTRPEAMSTCSPSRRPSPEGTRARTPVGRRGAKPCRASHPIVVRVRQQNREPLGHASARTCSESACVGRSGVAG